MWHLQVYTLETTAQLSKTETTDSVGNKSKKYYVDDTTNGK